MSMPITVTKRDDDFKRERGGVDIVGYGKKCNCVSNK